LVDSKLLREFFHHAVRLANTRMTIREQVFTSKIIKELITSDYTITEMVTDGPVIKMTVLFDGEKPVELEGFWNTAGNPEFVSFREIS
jgi:hypothetical protein